MQPVGDFAAGAFLVYSPRDGDEERHADGLPNMAGNWPGRVPPAVPAEDLRQLRWQGPHHPRQTRADPEAHEAGKSIALIVVAERRLHLRQRGPVIDGILLATPARPSKLAIPPSPPEKAKVSMGCDPYHIAHSRSLAACSRSRQLPQKDNHHEDDHSGASVVGFRVLLCLDLGAIYRRPPRPGMVWAAGSFIRMGSPRLDGPAQCIIVAAEKSRILRDVDLQVLGPVRFFMKCSVHWTSDGDRRSMPHDPGAGSQRKGCAALAR